MRTFLKLLVLAPFAVIALAFALANRAMTTLSLDLFGGGDIAGPEISAPLFVILILAVMFGVVLGGAFTWLGQGRHRRAVRQAKAETQELQAQNENLRARLFAKTAADTQNTATAQNTLTKIAS